MSHNIIITGASSGFGRLTAQTLIQKGHTVVASMRGVEGKNRTVATQLKDEGAHIVEIDVTQDGSVDQGVRSAIEATGGIDVVVNNAGVGVIGLQESFTPDDWKKLFNINVFGVQRVNRAILPHMRAKASGLLIHVTSLLGRMVLPFYGPYNASKWAMEALAENYRVELSKFGIESCVVEPGGYPTSFHGSLLTPSDTSCVSSYGDFAHVPQLAFENFQKALEANPAQDPQHVADAIADLIDTPAGQRAFRTVVDSMGMGEHIEGYNQQLEKVTSGIYGNFGMADMLKLKAD